MFKKFVTIVMMLFIANILFPFNTVNTNAAPPPNYRTVTFDTQGGNEIPEQIYDLYDYDTGTYKEWDFKVIEPIPPIRKGYVFDVWCYRRWEESAGDWVLIPWDFDDFVPNSVDYFFTLYAQWTPIPYTLTVTGGTGSGDYTVEDTVTVTANSAPNGQRFKEWDISAEVEYTEGNSATETISFVMPAGDITLMAIYEDIPSATETTTNTVTTAVPTTTTANKTAANTITTPPKTGDNSSVSALIVICAFSIAFVFVAGKKHKSKKT